MKFEKYMVIETNNLGYILGEKKRDADWENAGSSLDATMFMQISNDDMPKLQYSLQNGVFATILPILNEEKAIKLKKHCDENLKDIKAKVEIFDKNSTELKNKIKELEKIEQEEREKNEREFAEKKAKEFAPIVQAFEKSGVQNVGKIDKLIEQNAQIIELLTKMTK